MYTVTVEIVDPGLTHRVQGQCPQTLVAHVIQLGLYDDIGISAPMLESLLVAGINSTLPYITMETSLGRVKLARDSIHLLVQSTDPLGDDLG